MKHSQHILLTLPLCTLMLLPLPVCALSSQPDRLPSAASMPLQKPAGTLQLSVQDIRAYNTTEQRLTLLKKDTFCSLQLDLVSKNTKTEDLINPEDPESWKRFAENIRISLPEQESFSFGEDPKIALASKEDEPLKLLVIFPEALYTGKGETLLFNVKIEGAASFEEQFEETLSFCLPDQDQPASPEEPNKDPYSAGTLQDPSINMVWPEFEDSGSDSDSSFDEESEPDAKPKTAAATPYIIVDRYTYGGEQVTAGKTFDLTIFFRNTSRTLPVENIMMSLETEEGLSITSSSNTFYVEKLGAGQTLSQTIQMKALGSEKSSSPSISISFRYEYVDDGVRQQQTSSERISIPVIEPDRFEVTAAEITEPVYTGEETVISIPYVNKGKGTLSNVAVSVDGDIPVLSKIQNLGNFEAGKSGTIDVVIMPDEVREYNFTVAIAYENASGDPVELKYPYKVTAETNFVMPDPVDVQPVEEQSGSSLGWLWWLLAIVILALGGYGLFRWKKQKKEKPDHKSEEDFLDDWISSLDEDETNPHRDTDRNGPRASK